MTFNNRKLLIMAAAVIILGLGYIIMTTPEERTVGEKIDDAINSLEDRTPAQKIEDAIKD